ncbi:peptidase S41 family protein-like protein [Phaeosphaeriaceae sp. PMI808]|nr:peptidase S41 family protein-like protein [Phaeosphaeriaceae sp. PMI808]
MRFFTVLPLLLAMVAAQRTTLNPSETIELIPTRAASSIRDIEPSNTQSVSGPIQSDRACAQIASAVGSSRLQFPSVQAELALACLKSVPISQRDATTTIDALKKMVEFQSTITYLKSPPQGWPNEKVDVLAGLNDIGMKVKNGGYANEYDFETDIASLFIKAHDGHLNFNGMAYAGAFRWRRSSQIALISASKDGNDIPRVWAISDFNATNASFEPSPITKINGQEVSQFFEAATALNAYHDPDTRYNAMFFMQPAENFGYFVNPRFYPGPTTSVSYENGTTQTYMNSAIVLEPRAWQYISDPESFYETYIAPSTSSQRVKPRDPNALPHHLENPRDHEFHSAFTIQHGSVPLSYPRPFIAHSAAQVPLAGYFINTAQGQIGVLVVQTFNTDDDAGAREFQRVIQRYIAEAKTRGVAKHIIDVRTNGGGKVLSGYDMYLQFFPSKAPQAQSRYRGHRASEVFGKSISSFTVPTVSNAEFFTSPFSNDAYLSTNLTKFLDWNAMYPPTHFNGDTFTSLLKYNLSDPLTTSNQRLAVGIVPTGYGNRANFTEDPFRAEDLLILSDGICASTCSIFLELMVQQARVKTLAVGGRPRDGPMVPVGGTKGTLVLPHTYLLSLSAFVISNFAANTSQAREWSDFVPTPFGISVHDASVNFQDNIRAGLEVDGIPTQFLNDTASCRIWYEPRMYLNVTRLWEKTAAVAFGGDKGGMNNGACVKGSISSREQQTGQGAGNPATGGGNGTSNGGGNKKDAAAGLKPGGWAAMICVVVVLGSLNFV